MKNFRVNRKGQFTIIAALLVAVVLVAAVMTTYSSIRYSTLQEQPQMLSAIDEVNLALKKILGFTVGYYGSVLQVTGNTSYAKILASRYLSSGLDNIADIRPEWAPSFNVINLDLRTNWFTNTSYSSGNFTIKYSLGGIGVKDMTYSASSRLDAQILESSTIGQAKLNVTSDFEPLVDLGQSSFRFYKYIFSNSTWEFVLSSSEPITYMNGIYVIDLPSGMNSSYVVEIEDTRGLMVVASAFSQFASSLTWNTTSVEQGFDYVDSTNPIIGTHSDFSAQQSFPDSVFDSLREDASGTVSSNYYPNYSWGIGSTTLVSGSVVDLQNNDQHYMQLHSYPSAFSGTTVLGYSTAGTTTQDLDDTIRGSVITTGTGGQVESISAYLKVVKKTANVQAAIYSTNNILVGRASEQNVGTTNGQWITFNFATKPLLEPNTNYVLVVWGQAGSEVYVYGTSTTYQSYYDDNRQYSSNNWPNPDNAFHSQNNFRYSVNCTLSLASQYTVQVEFTGTSDLINWQQLTWTIDSSVNVGTANYTLQLYNFSAGKYPTSGDAYINLPNLGTTDSLETKTIAVNPTNFRNGSSNWKVMITANTTTATPFDLKVDLVQLTTQFTNYALNIEEQWTSLNATNPRQDLCIKAETLPANENLIVQLQRSSSWINLATLASGWNNISLASYIDSTNLTIRFIDSNSLTDPTQHSWDIDSVFIKPQANIDYLINLQESTFTVEVLQNGTMRWLGQNLQLTTQELPIPPVPVKAIHVNQTFVNGTNKEVLFQIEDWASNYQIPLGLTSNATVFSNRQMIVFLADNKVTEFTIWWDGSDAAVQTPLAYTNRYFHDDVANYILRNGRQTLQLAKSGFSLTSTVGSVSSTANLMRINNKEDTTNPELSIVIPNGIVRDIVLGEAEFSGGVDTCSNVYTNIVITLPANVTYYTYQLRLMFIDSSRTRTITDLTPIRVETDFDIEQAQTEDDTLAGFPVIQSGTGTFSNYASVGWTAHHWSQLITNDGKQGTGIMFTDTANQRLYAFDSIISQATGDINVNLSNHLIELSPIDLAQVTPFKSALDISWSGAVATFDNTTPICKMYDASTPTGLWILAEYPPTITVTAKS